MKKLLLSAFIAFLAMVHLLNAQVKKELTLQTIFASNTFSSEFARGFNILNDDSTYSQIVNNSNKTEIRRYSLRTGNDLGLIADISGINGVAGYSFSEDEKKILLYTQAESIYRRSFKAEYVVMDITTGLTTTISDQKIMYATFNHSGNKVAYVKNNNLYIFDIPTKTEKAITFDGEKNKIINGAVDWVYEEEFSMSQGFEWSPDGKYLAYLRFDESAVKEFTMPIYGNLYPENETWKYPKAGEDNSKVTVYVYEVEKGIQQMVLNSGGDIEYLPRIQFSPDAKYLISQGLNRYQNSWRIHAYELEKNLGTVVYAEQAPNFINIPEQLVFIPGENQLLFTSEKSGYNHIYCLDYSKGKSKSITDGNWEVTTVYGIDIEKKAIYFSSSEVSALENHLYTIQLNGKSKSRLTQDPGNHMIEFSPKFTYFTDLYSTINQPRQFYLRKTDGTFNRVIFNNEKLRNELKNYGFSEVKFGTMTTDSGVLLNYWMILPPNFDSTQKYPVLMHCYGGPGHNTVRNEWMGSNYYWHQYLASKGYIIVSVDNRGTGFRGRAFSQSTYKQLGRLECIDQISAAKWLSNKTWVDASRIGIWGWSFGGYLSSLCISKGSDVFKSAIAVAPVTNWRYYDNIYTERYMGLPQENAKGYDENSPIHHVSKIKGNYLIIHGTADDNVHFQNSVEMVNAMIALGIKFDSEFYPNRNHGIGDGKARMHLYQRMTEFIINKL